MSSFLIVRLSHTEVQSASVKIILEVEQVTQYIYQLIIFDESKGKFTDNWNIKYSSYLTYLYGFEHESAYQDEFKSKVSSWNRVVGRIKRGDKMTANNLAYIEEIKAQFPNWEEIVNNFKPEETGESEVNE